MKIFCLLIVIFLVESCNSQSNKVSSMRDSSKNDSISHYDDFIHIIGRYLKVDSLNNPFLSIDTIHIKNCDSLIDTRNHFDCIIRNFFKCKFPIELGPKPEPNFGVLKILLDSIFIVKSLSDKEYFKTEPGDRTAGYYYGSILDISENYILCLIPFGFCCGHEYYLYSINKNGKMIDKICVGGLTSDAYETYGIIENKNRFEVYKNNFGFKDGTDSKAFLSKKDHFKYKISKSGTFEKE